MDQGGGQGASDLNQLSVIFKVFGVPTEDAWESYGSLPGVRKGTEWNNVDPMWKSMGSMSLTGEAAVKEEDKAANAVSEVEWWERLFERVIKVEGERGREAVKLVRDLCKLDPLKRVKAGEAGRGLYCTGDVDKIQESTAENESTSTSPPPSKKIKKEE